MLTGGNVGGFGPHPGKPDPNGRDKEHNVEGWRNGLKEMVRNMHQNETVQDYLARQGLSAKDIDDFILQTKNFIEHGLPYSTTDEQLTTEVLKLAGQLGLLP